MDRSAIEKIEELAIEGAGANLLSTHTPAIILAGKVVSLEHLDASRSRFRGRFGTSQLAEYVSYLKANTGGIGFIDPKSPNATVYLNLGDTENPGHGDWTASLALDPTAGYAAILAVEGKRLSQRELVEWIEDWVPQLSAKYGEQAEAVGIGQALLAIRNLTISAKSDVTHTDKDFGASRTALEDIEAKAAGGIPTHLVFRTVPYTGFTEREFRLRISVISGEKPALTLRIVSKEAVGEDIAREFKSLLLSDVGDAATLTIGSFSP